MQNLKKTNTTSREEKAMVTIEKLAYGTTSKEEKIEIYKPKNAKRLLQKHITNQAEEFWK